LYPSITILSNKLIKKLKTSEKYFFILLVECTGLKEI
jgi:hypothetical protein